LFCFRVARLERRDVVKSYYGFFSLLYAYYNRVAFKKVHSIAGVYTYISALYDINFHMFDSILVGICKIVKEYKTSLKDAMTFASLMACEWGFDTEAKTPKFSFAALEDSHISMNFALVKHGACCDYPMP